MMQFSCIISQKKIYNFIFFQLPVSFICIQKNKFENKSKNIYIKYQKSTILKVHFCFSQYLSLSIDKKCCRGLNKYCRDLKNYFKCNKKCCRSAQNRDFLKIFTQKKTVCYQKSYIRLYFEKQLSKFLCHSTFNKSVEKLKSYYIVRWVC